MIKQQIKAKLYPNTVGSCNYKYVFLCCCFDHTIFSTLQAVMLLLTDKNNGQNFSVWKADVEMPLCIPSRGQKGERPLVA